MPDLTLVAAPDQPVRLQPRQMAFDRAHAALAPRRQLPVRRMRVAPLVVGHVRQTHQHARGTIMLGIHRREPERPIDRVHAHDTPPDLIESNRARSTEMLGTGTSSIIDR